MLLSFAALPAFRALEQKMKSALAFLDAINRGLTPEQAIASIPVYLPPYSAGLPSEIYFAAQHFGWRFFPCSFANSLEQRSYLKYATNDLNVLRTWARRHPKWALATKASGVLAIEVDGSEGRESLLALCGDDWDW